MDSDSDGSGGPPPAAGPGQDQATGDGGGDDGQVLAQEKMDDFYAAKRKASTNKISPEDAGVDTAFMAKKMAQAQGPTKGNKVDEKRPLTKAEKAAEKKQKQVDKKKAMAAERKARKHHRHFDEKSFFEKARDWRLVPETRLYMIWELLIIAAVLWVAVALPFTIGFGLVEEDMWSFAIIMEYGTDQLFMIDVALQFFTAYVDKWGNLHKNRRSIARRYVKGYFLIDFVAAIPFDYFLTSGAVKKLAMIKGIRLLRIFKVFKFLDKFKSSNIWKIFRLFGGFLLFAHWLACFWWYVGVNWRGDIWGTETWVTAYILDGWSHPSHAGYSGSGTFPSPIVYQTYLEEDCYPEGCGPDVEGCVPGCEDDGQLSPNFPDMHIRFKYARCLYWALTTVTSVGYGDICPITYAETILVIFIELVGAAFYATIFSNMAVYVASLDAVHNRYIEKMQSVHEQMTYLKIPKSIAHKVEHYYEYIYLRHKSLLEEDDYFYRGLPAPLEREICMYLHAGTVEAVHLFRGCSEAFIRELVTKLKPQIFIPYEYVFNRGGQAKFMFFISRGAVEVLTDLDGDKLGELHDGDYFGEMAVLQNTLRTCSARTKTFCDLYTIEGGELHELLSTFEDDKALVLHNAISFFDEDDNS